MRVRACERCGGPIQQERGRPRLMHPECRRQERLEYWRARSARKRGQLELLGPALRPLVSTLANDRSRAEFVAFSVWAQQTARHELKRNLSVGQRVRFQEHLKYAELLGSLAREAPAPAALRRTEPRSPSGPEGVETTDRR